MTTESKSELKRKEIQKKSKASVVSGDDAVIRINMFLPEMQPEERVIRIKNLKGRATASQRTVQSVANAIALGLMSKYGKNLG